MYLGELTIGLGLSQLIGGTVPTVLWFFCGLFIFLLCIEEDRAMRARFGEAHAEWSRSTARLIPWVF